MATQNEIKQPEQPAMTITLEVSERVAIKKAIMTENARLTRSRNKETNEIIRFEYDKALNLNNKIALKL